MNMKDKNWVSRIIELANTNPEPSEPNGNYVPDSNAYIYRAECAGCGVTEVGDWKRFNGGDGWTSAVQNGKYIRACPKCSETLKNAKREQSRLHREAWDKDNKERSQARDFMTKWELANPRPTAGRIPFKEVFVRKSTCGRCGVVHEAEAPLHAMPRSPEGWKHSEDDKRGSIVCPKCFEETAPMRAEIADWKARRDSAVGEKFRKLEYPVMPDLVLPESWRS